jgi:hypothetical protein
VECHGEALYVPENAAVKMKEVFLISNLLLNMGGGIETRILTIKHMDVGDA